MNTTPNAIGALSEIDRLGQAALDAIWEEDRHRHPRHEEITQLLKLHDQQGGNSTEVFDRLQEILGVNNPGDVIRYAMTEFQVGNARARAVSSYLSARRLLTSAGMI